MEMSVAEAAQHLGVDPSRVRAMVRGGQLRARRLGRIWLIDEEHLVQLGRAARPPGRPLAPARAWAALDLLAGGRAPWLEATARTQIRRTLAEHRRDDADQWAALLRNLVAEHQGYVHPAGLSRLANRDDVVTAAIDAKELGLVDLVQAHEYFVAADSWRSVVAEFHIDAERLAGVRNIRALECRDVNAPAVLGTDHGRALAASAVHLRVLDPRVRNAAAAHLQRACAAWL